MITQATLADFASQMAGVPVIVKCDDPRTFEQDSLGYVIWVGDQIVRTIHLPRAECVSLMHLDDPVVSSTVRAAPFTVKGQIADVDGGSDVLALEHEALHIRLNSKDESCVEATAVANVWQLVKLFKLPAVKAAQVLRGALLSDQNAPFDYRKGCS